MNNYFYIIITTNTQIPTKEILKFPYLPEIPFFFSLILKQLLTLKKLQTHRKLQK